MEKKYALMLFVLLSAGLSQVRAAEAKPVYQWVSANEFILSFQHLKTCICRAAATP